MTSYKLTHRFVVMLCLSLLTVVSIVPQAQAFCGFFVSKAGADLFNEASKVVLARADDRTVITMSNDFRGDVSEFAIVVPVPTVLKEGQINVTENKIVEHLDAYTAPRLVEYFDEDPCAPRVYAEMAMQSAMPMGRSVDAIKKSAKSLGVTVEAEYTVGEYDIQILSAKESDGLLTWLNQESYKLPSGAEPILNSYIKQDMKFFVAKVNLEEKAKLGYSMLRPIQVAYTHKKFMLPIRLGTLNADSTQDIIVYALTRKGRVEPANYRSMKIPSNMDLPLYVKDDFGTFYKAMFRHAAEKEGLKAVFLEYAWDMGWCDPCAADPLPNKDLKTLGVWWLGGGNDGRPTPVPMPGQPRIMPVPPQQGQDVFVTRLHARYTAETFPEDLMLHETADRQNFQGRYVMRHPFKGTASCEAGKNYLASLPDRFEKEAQALANITGWNITEIRSNMEKKGQSFSAPETPEPKPWWEDMWAK